MELNKFVKQPVLPGSPLVAASWNHIVDALEAVIQKLLAADTFGLRVTVQGADPASVRVTAVDQATQLVFEAVRPVGTDKDHVFASLKPGTYQVRAEAPGFAPSTASKEIKQAAETLSLTLASNSVTMPDLFGVKLLDALKTLKDANITVKEVRDVTGKAEPPTSPSPDAGAAAVLAQLPPAGHPVALGDTARLVIAVVVKSTVMVEVPSLIGLTQEQAKQALEAKGLSLGAVTEAQVVTVEVPDLSGLTEAQARQALEAKGLKLGTVTAAQEKTPSGPTGPVGPDLPLEPGGGQVNF